MDADSFLAAFALNTSVREHAPLTETDRRRCHGDVRFGPDTSPVRTRHAAQCYTYALSSAQGSPSITYTMAHMWGEVRAPNYEQFTERDTPAWFKNAKFGIFVHWGYVNNVRSGSVY